MKMDTVYTLSSLLAVFLALHTLWCIFIAFPIAFEKNLKSGKAWVYIPFRWKGFYKFQIGLLTRILILILSSLTTLLLMQVTQKKEVPWIIFYSILALVSFNKGTSILLQHRFRQQEDCYYFLHDELKEKLESEGKDLTETAFKNLAAYQHHQFLHMADRNGHLIKSLNSQAHSLRKSRRDKLQSKIEMAV